jgi:hypothetical protein
VEVEINARWGASNFVVVGLSLAGEFYASAGGGVNCWVPASGDRRTLVTASIASEDVLAAGASTASHAFARARSLGLCLSGPTCPIGCPSSLASARRAAPGRTVQRGQLDPMEVCGGSMSPSANSRRGARAPLPRSDTTWLVLSPLPRGINLDPICDIVCAGARVSAVSGRSVSTAPLSTAGRVGVALREQGTPMSPSRMDDNQTVCVSI